MAAYKSAATGAREATRMKDRIRKLEEQKADIGEQIANCGRPVRTFDETVRTALDFLGNPWKLWSSERIEDKRRC